MARLDLTRDQVKKAERPAWARAVVDGPEEYYFDGIYFWHVPAYSGSRAVREDDTPHAPWRHRAVCNCPLCAAALDDRENTGTRGPADGGQRG